MLSLLTCPSHLHRTAVGITESRWAGSINLPLNPCPYLFMPREAPPPYLR